MAAPMTSGVAALMASANPRLGGVELRSLLLQSAARSQLPVAAGYVDALRAVLAASTAVGYDASQPPRLRILQATSKGARTTIQVAALGSTTAIRRYVVTLDGKRAARLAARASPFAVALRQKGRRVGVRALDASGRTLASTALRVQALRSGKRGAQTGGRVGT
jgi:subtilisin family serine protease